MLDDHHAIEIARHYSLGTVETLSGPVARGEQGWVWRLDTAERSYAVKEPFWRQPESDVREDADYQDAIRGAGIPAPAVIRTAEGDVMLDLDDTQVRLYEWVDLLEANNRIDASEVGRLVAAIHRVSFIGQRPVDPWYTDPVGAIRWDELLRDLARARAPFVDDLVALRDELVALERLIEPPVDLRTCHRDLWADNVRGTHGGGVCVIDWENCGLADPTQELCVVLFEFGSDRARARNLYRAYVEGGGPGRIDRPGNFSMVIAQLGHIGEISCRPWLDPDASDAERDRSVARVAEFTTSPLTRAVVAELLDAVLASD